MSSETDAIRASARAGQLVQVEGVAGDGAHGHTLLDAEQRIAIARVQARMFGASASRRLIFVAGDPSLGREEVTIVERVCDEVETCHVQTQCRPDRQDVLQGVTLAARARHGRAQIAVPASAPASRALLHCEPAAAFDRAGECLALARERAPDVALDICLSDAGRADAGLLAAGCNRLTAAGAATITLADSVGCLYPDRLAALLTTLRPRLEPAVALRLHLRDDLGLALANALVGLRHGVRIFESAWLGLGPRAGQLATERLLGALSLADGADGRADIGRGLFVPPLDLPRLATLARRIAVWLDLPLRTCEPFVGAGAHTLTRGAPFDPALDLRAYDPSRLGLSTGAALTHLADAPLVTHVAAEMGFAIGPVAARAALAWLKAEAHRRGRAEIERAALAEFFRREGLTPHNGA